MITYLTSPYSSKEKGVPQQRFEEVEKATAFFMKHGHAVYSPIVHCHRIASLYDLPTDADFWWRYNQRFMIAARDIWVLKLEGWSESKGVRMEVDFANTFFKPVLYIEPDQLTRYV